MSDVSLSMLITDTTAGVPAGAAYHFGRGIRHALTSQGPGGKLFPGCPWGPHILPPRIARNLGHFCGLAVNGKTRRPAHVVGHFENRSHLPVVELRRAA